MHIHFLNTANAGDDQRSDGTLLLGKEAGLRAQIIFVLVFTAMVSCFAYAQGAQSVQIASPEPDETVHDNSGNLVIKVVVSRPLNAEAGDYLVLLLDGKEVSRGSALSFELKGIDRGAHTLQAQRNAADGAVLAASPQVVFHMWRASRLFPGRKN